MSQANWKRYYAVVVEDMGGSVRLAIRFSGQTFHASRAGAHEAAKRMRLLNMPIKVIGVVGVRGRKSYPEIQQWLLDHSS